MKASRFVLLILAATAVFALNSCNKDKEDPTVTFHQPFAADMHYLEGTWFKLEAFIDDDAGLTNYGVFITDSIGAVSLELDIAREAEVTGTGFIHRDSVIIPFGTASWYDGSYNVNIRAKDAEGNEVLEQRRFFVDP